MDDEISITEQVEIINHYTRQLRNSGYEYDQSKDIIISALKGVIRKRENRAGEKKRYKTGAETLEKRMNDKLIEASTWFRSKEIEKIEKLGEESQTSLENFKEKTKSWKIWRNIKKRRYRNNRMSEIENSTGEKRKLEGVIFIQYTEHSTLAKNIRRRLLDIEKVGQLKIKLVERAGDKLEELLHRSDAWSDRDCDRADCLPCKSAGENGAKGSCKRRNVIYETYCISCQEIIEKDEEKREIELREKNGSKRKRENIDGEKIKENYKQKDYKIKYIGESYRSAYERGREHQDDLKYLREKSHLLKHFLEAHPNEKIEDMKYGMRLVSKCKTALERQVGEAVYIQLAQEKGYTLLNSKSEYSRCTIPRLRLGDSKGLLEQLEGERQSEKNMKERIRLLRKRKDSNEKKKKKRKIRRHL